MIYLPKHQRLLSARKQKGASLVISLILLVIMTLLGLAGIRGVTQQERMANHTVDRSIAFQATEAALRDIEQLVETHKPTPTAGCAVVSALMSCAPPVPADIPRWLRTGLESPNPEPSFAWEDLSVAVGAGALAATPQYFVEYLGGNFECQPGDPSTTTDCKRYRITARSHDGDSTRSSVMLQSIYATD